MKTHIILLALALTLPFGLFSQTIPGRLSNNGFAIQDAATGATLSSDELADILSADEYSSYLSGMKFRKTSKALTLAGVGAAFAGITFFALCLENQSRHPKDDYTAAITVAGTVCGLGVASIIAGIPLRSVGKGKIEDVCNAYNGRQSSLALVGTQNGIGVALVF